MTQEITVTKTEDHYEMTFGDSEDGYPVPTNAIETLDDDLTPEIVGESVMFEGEYGGHKHAKQFDVETVVDEPGEDDDTDADDGEDADPAPVTERFDEGDRVENPSQRPGTEYEVVEVGDGEDIFGNPEPVFKVQRADGRGTVDEIAARDQPNWRLAE